jgi:hypothetical protein
MRISSFFLSLLLGISMVPAANADVTFDVANSGNCFPFGGCPFPNANIEYEQVYSHYKFGTDPLEITGISFKPDQSKPSAFEPTPIELTLTLSTTKTEAGFVYGDPFNKPITTSFSENLGTNTQVVFSGTATLSSSGDNVFDISIPFSTPYLYDPSKGNLLVGVSDIDGSVPHIGFAAGGSILISRYYNTNFDGTPNIDTDIGTGLATNFTSVSTPCPVPLPEIPVSAVPEPETYGMMFAGLGLIGFMARRRNKT